jgi:hypothetical protein
MMPAQMNGSWRQRGHRSPAGADQVGRACLDGADNTAISAAQPLGELGVEVTRRREPA